jgi:hypothetical protein
MLKVSTVIGIAIMLPSLVILAQQPELPTNSLPSLVLFLGFAIALNSANLFATLNPRYLWLFPKVWGMPKQLVWAGLVFFDVAIFVIPFPSVFGITTPYQYFFYGVVVAGVSVLVPLITLIAIAQSWEAWKIL